MQYRGRRHSFKAKIPADAGLCRFHFCSWLANCWHTSCSSAASGDSSAPPTCCAFSPSPPPQFPQLPFSNEASVSAALLKSQAGDAGLDAGSFVSVGLWHRIRSLNSRMHKRHGAAAATSASTHATGAPASPSSSDTGSSDSEVEGVPALLPFKADAARTANGTLVVSCRVAECY